MLDTIQSPTDPPILVDFADEHGLVQASLTGDVKKWVEKSKESLDLAMITIMGMAYRAAELREKIPEEFTSADIEFGVKLDFEAGALLAKAGGEGSIKVKLTWQRPSPPTT